MIAVVPHMLPHRFPPPDPIGAMVGFLLVVALLMVLGLRWGSR